jgi:hypothetical protein
MAMDISVAKTHWFTKFTALLLAGLGIANTLTMAIELVPEKWLEAAGDWFELVLPVVQLVLPLLLAILLATIWHRKPFGRAKDANRYGLLLGIVRYWLAFQICTYGFAKILGTQFHTPIYRLDLPMGSVSGFGLTWYYFGYSRALSLIIAGLQIVGSIMLMFRRTTLLGCLVLLPVMANILLINVFYDIAVGAFLNSVLFTIGLLFLLWWYRQTLRQWLLIPLFGEYTAAKPWRQWVLRVGVLVGSFFFIQSFLVSNKPDRVLQGKWMVNRYVRGGDTLGVDQWLHDSTAWKVLYFDGTRGGAAFCPNPYCYVPEQSAKGKYTYTAANNSLKATFLDNKNAPYDSIEATVAVVADTLLTLKGKHTNKPFELVAKRVKR